MALKVGALFLFEFVRFAFSYSNTFLGFAYPAPLGSQISSVHHSIASELNDTLREILTSGQSRYGNYSPDATSVSMKLMSAADNATIFAFDYAASNLVQHGDAIPAVNQNSVFRIGSVSKLLTVYAFLLKGGYDYWDHAITEFVPELREAATRTATQSPVNHVRWEEITLGSLCSQLSGIGRDYTEADLSTLDFPWVQYGLPPLNMSEIPRCGADASQPPCSRSKYLSGFSNRSPVFLPYSTPTYSNAAFRILSYAMANLSGREYKDLMFQDVIKPLGLLHTSISLPANASVGVIPKGSSGWYYDLGEDAATGGIYSSVADMTKFAHSILRNQQLSAQTTRRWLKPETHTSSVQFSVGAPWEIWRSPADIRSGRVIDLYSKGGSTSAYNSLLVISPDYNVSLAILTAGPDGAVVSTVAALTIEKYLPLLERASKDQLCRRLCGDYVSQSSSNSSLSITIDHSPGLRISRWISNGSDLLETAQAYSDATGGGNIASLRVAPTTLIEEVSVGSRRAYRVIFETESIFPEPPIFFNNQNAWGAVDQLTYGKVPLDEFVFEFDENGEATKLTAKGLRIALLRQPKSKAALASRSLVATGFKQALFPNGEQSLLDVFL